MGGSDAEAEEFGADVHGPNHDNQEQKHVAKKPKLDSKSETAGEQNGVAEDDEVTW